jgi:hypothetical protein
MSTNQLSLSLVALLLSFGFGEAAQDTESSPKSLTDTNTAIIPGLIRPDGKLTSEGFRFSTEAYEREAVKLLLEEANRVAKELRLPESLPITESNLTRVFIVRYGMSLMKPKMIGNIHTKDYGYFVSVGHRLSYVEGAHQDEDALRWMDEYRWPKDRLDTQGAYQLATQWLAAARMDVESLNRECRVQIKPDPFANRDPGRGKFVPIYFVSWQSPQNRAEGYGDVASVKLFYPSKTLISMRVEASKYILRPPLVFTNLDQLLLETNAPASRR